MSSQALKGGSEPREGRPARPMRKVSIGSLDVTVERRPDGTIDVRPVQPLAPYPTRLTDRLHYWAALAPDRVFVSERDRDGAWRTVTYAQTLAAVRRLGQSLLDRGLSAERPLLILSGNSVNHALLGLAALYVGVPYAPVSPPYSLVSIDHAKLRHVVELLTPGLVYADDWAAFVQGDHGSRPRRRRRGGRQSRTGSFRARRRVRRPRRPRGDSRGGPGIRPGRPRHHRQVPPDLRVHRASQGRDQHPAHAQQ